MGVKALALIQNKDKFCGLLNSLGEHSFAQDMDLTNRESVARNNEMKGARKFGTEDNQVLKGLERYEGGDKAKAKDTKADDLEQTSSRAGGRESRSRERAQKREEER